MARVTAFGQPANDVERMRSTTRGHLPDTYEIIHNLEIKQDKEVFDRSGALGSPVRVCSRYQGNSRSHPVYGSKWHPENRQPYHSVAKLRQHAKILSSLIVIPTACIPFAPDSRSGSSANDC